MRARSGKTGINSFAADAAVVWAGDEYNSYAADFLDSSHAKYSDTGGKRLSDFAAAYFVGAENSARAKPMFEILSLDIRRASKSVGEECAAIAELLERSGVAKGGVSRCFSSKGANGYQRKFLKSLADKIVASFTKPAVKIRRQLLSVAFRFLRMRWADGGHMPFNTHFLKLQCGRLRLFKVL